MRAQARLAVEEQSLEQPAEASETSTRYNLMDAVGPNKLVLEAQGRVCTGPKQTRPLDEATCRAVLTAILQSVRGELPARERVSRAQMGAFFGAMALRATAFPAETQWSEGEHAAMTAMWPDLQANLPPDVLFLADPEGSLLGGLQGGAAYTGGPGVAEMRLVGCLREVLAGGHLGFEEVAMLLHEVLPLRGGHAGGQWAELGDGGYVSDALMAAFLICQRMNRETERELKGYCMALEDDTGPAPVVAVPSLTHYGDPYDGNTRFMRSTLFVAAVRASYGEACLLHGTDAMPPKMGVAEEAMLNVLGARTTLSAADAAVLVEDSAVGWAYLSQREAQPSLHSLRDLRLHIKKRPTFATTEKVQRFLRSRGREAMVAGYYHEGYEAPLLMLIRRQGVEAGLVVKGEEGALSLTTKARAADSGGGPGDRQLQPVNSCSGFRPGKGTPGEEALVKRETFAHVVDAQEHGFASTPTPRTDRQVAKNLELGLAALKGERGPAYDRIVFNAAMQDHLLGCDGASDVGVAVARAREAIDSGNALKRLEAYITQSRKL